MKRIIPLTILLLVCLVLIAPVTPLHAEETEIQGVTASIEHLRQYNGVTHLGVRLTNHTDKEAAATKPIEFSKIVLADTGKGKKYSAMKGADGRYLAGPVSDWGEGGRWFPLIPPKSSILVWVLFDAAPQATSLSVQMPLMFSFDGVKVSGQPVTVKDVQSAVPPLKATVVSAVRSAGQVKVRVKIVNPGKQKARGLPLRYADTYLFDTVNKRKYPVLKDQSGKYLAEPISDDKDGGRFWYSYVEPGGQALVSVTFQPPPDSTRAVDIVIPLLDPFENISIVGEGGASSAGVAVAGKSQTLDGALKDLGADVSSQEIKVQLTSDLLFDFDKADIKKDGEQVLEKVVVILKSYPNSKITVEGHTDNMGKEQYNITLSEKRASTVARWIIAKSGIRAANVQTKGWGRSKPVAHNTKPDGSDDPAGRAKNRRVEIIIKKTSQ